MSKTMKILLLLVVVIGGAAAAAYFMKLGPFKEDTPTAAVGVVAAAGTPGANPCPDGTAGAAVTPETATTPGAGAATTTDPAAGAAATPTTPTVDPATGAPATTTGAPAPGAAATGDGTLAASGTVPRGYASDTPIYAEGETATTPSAVTDPAAATSTATPTTTSVDPATAGAGAGAATPTAVGAVDPCADTAGGAAAGGGAAAAGAAGTGAAAGAASTKGTLAVGTSTGNNDAAVLIAAAVAKIGARNKFMFEVAATLVPAAGGIGVSGKQLANYRKTVTGSTLRLKIADPESMQRWSAAKKASKLAYMRSVLTLLGKNYPKSTRSVTIVSDQNQVMAIGDVAVGGTARVKVFR